MNQQVFSEHQWKCMGVEAVVSGDGGGSMWRWRWKYVETEVEVYGDGEYK
jgi:hypothetical protein